ncbi:carboxypeptidase-like regulatory domain-containing protein [Hymenobacter negativus]|uniref:Carboxypeptidase-like regulatory domain-containing protein n=1 Tax=Hymenobacter negativus TaxID=2795026 RepID=A0ABS3QNR0_9BACT|nr:carboxypeptidase-like regulatory domain-containing protein [Hymenobacter negativus]MBO2012912.1 carboxypeptidase-like regulatory domain-containing protein [Hymenobacter negativus]
MRYIGLLVLLISFAADALAQGGGVLRGRVFDAETHQPIPNAQVGVANNRIGTSTNEDGRFALNIPATYAQEKLTVALIGYRPYSQALPPLPGPELRIELRLAPASLSEVQVTASVVGIVREAVARIPQNYPVRPTRLTGFYRESDHDEVGQARYLVEGLLAVFKVTYQRRTDAGDVQIQQSRKMDLRPNKELVHIDWAGGPFIPHMGDFVHVRSQFIDPSHFRDYDYRLAPGSSYAGRPVYVITFAPKPGNQRADFEGRMYIDQDTYTFLGAEWRYTPAGLRHSPNAADSRALRVSYQPYAGRWHLKSVWWQTKFRHPVWGDINYFGEFLTTAIDTAQAPPPTYMERAQYEDVFLRNTVGYDSAFWRGQTTLLPPEAPQKSLLDQRRQQLADSLFRPKPATDSTAAVKKEGWLGQLFDRFHFWSAVGTWPLAVPTASLAVAYAPAGYGFRMQATNEVAAQSLTVLYRIGYQVDITRKLAVRMATQRLYRQFGDDGWDGWEAGLSYQHNLNPRRRPIYARAGLGYTRQTVGRSLGTFENPDDGLRVVGKHLGADKLSVQIQSVTSAVQPTVGLGLELRHLIELTADLGYLLPLSTRSQLQVSEESRFSLFRSTAAIPLPAADVSLRVNDQPTTTVPWQQQHWLLSIGVMFRMR